MENIRQDFINQYPPLNLMKTQAVGQMLSPATVHMYIHIPYCIKKCDFCYYKSYETKMGGVPEEYLDALLHEIDLYAARSSYVLRSLYLGGGTPTMMSVKQMDILLSHIYQKFPRTEDFEFCCEARPGPETTKEKIALLTKTYHLKRVSIGCQSLNDNILRMNGRNHSRRVFLDVYEMLRKCGVYSVNVDLMSGMIGDTQSGFLQTVQDLLALQPENITIYKLQLYYNSKLAMSLRKEKEVSLASDKEEYEMTKAAYELILQNGYEFADDFSFRKNNRFSHLHRQGVWDGESMLGIGVSSHALSQEYIYQNTNDLAEYYDELQQGRLPINRAYHFSSYEAMVRHFIFGLKSMKYDMERFNKKFGIPLDRVFGKELLSILSQGNVSIKHGVLYLNIEGALRADDMVRSIFPMNQDKVIMGQIVREKLR